MIISVLFRYFETLSHPLGRGLCEDNCIIRVKLIVELNFIGKIPMSFHVNPSISIDICVICVDTSIESR